MLNGAKVSYSVGRDAQDALIPERIQVILSTRPLNGNANHPEALVSQL